MRCCPILRVRLFILSLGCFWAASAFAAGEVTRGETLDPSTFGPGIVESMADALARDRLNRQPEPVDPFARAGKHGEWVVPSRRSTYFPHDGEHNVVNKWGDIHMGIGFPAVVDVRGAYFAAQGAKGTWAKGVRVIGYRDGEEVARTDWFEHIGVKPAWFDMNLRQVDRIVILAVPVSKGGGWYGMDDLTFTLPPEPGQESGRVVVLGFEDVRYHTVLTGSDYAGLTWEAGQGRFDTNVIPAPQTVPAPAPGEPSEAAEQEAAEVLSRAGRATLPILTQDFQGVIRGDAGQFSAPPDTDGAIGPNHFVITVNRVFAVYDKVSGGELMSMSLGSFLPGSSGDPRVLYDHHSGRWVVIVSDFSARIYLAVSLSDDPTGDWYKTSILISQGGDAGCWPDYPTLGVDEYGIYSASYMVGCGMTILAIDKAPLIAPSPSLGTVTAFRTLPWEGAIQPAHTYGSPGGEYLVSRADSTSLRVRRIDPPLTGPSLVEVGFVTIPYHDYPPDAPALGCSTPLDTVDWRPMNAVYRDGSLWTTHCIGFDGRAAARWYEIDPVAVTLTQYGTVADPSLYYFFPSICVNRFGRVVLGFSGSNAGQYASAYYTGRISSDPPGEMAPPEMYHAGVAGQDIIDGYGRNRFGDYSYTTLDPDDELTIWTIQEYGHADDIWGTWVGVLTSSDCNGNLIDDYQDIAEGTSEDCNTNGVPDECEPNEDCNGNAVQDICDIAGVTSDDCNANKIPDECDVSSGTSADANGNNVPDECEAARLYVNGSATGLEQGTTWANAYTDLQHALDVAMLPGSAVTEVWVAAGTYLPSRQSSSDTRSATFELVDGVALLGGFAGDETYAEQRAPDVYATILSGDLGQNDGSGTLDDNAYHVVSARGIGSTAVLDGFVITAGRADAAADPNDRGGGTLCDNASPTIRGCAFRNNHAANRGGGFMVKEVSGPVVNGCVFQNNTADVHGGGLFNSGSSTATIVNSLFTGNTAVYGGGMANNGTPDVNCCSFSGNSASTWGGGIYSFKSDAVLTVTNSVLWGNSDNGGTDESAQVHVAGGTAALTHNCVQGWSSPGVDGNIDTDPQFVDADGADDVFGTADDDLRLTAGSGCIDAGDNAAVPPGVLTDLDGRLRFRDGDGDQIAIVDMGAYEYMPSAAGCICGDINGSGGLIDLNDFSLFALCFGQSASSGDCSEEAFACSDLDASGSVNLNDFSTFALLFGVTSTNEVPDCLR